jgi:DNA primase
MNKPSSDIELRILIDTVKGLIDGEALLQALGFTISVSNSHEIRCACIIHGGDGVTSFRYKVSTNTFSCFSQHCHEKYGHDVIALVRAVKNVSFIESLEYLCDFVGVSFEGLELSEKDILLFKERVLLKESQNIKKFDEFTSNTEQKEATISESTIKKFISNRSDYFLNRGFSLNTLDKFEIGSTSYFKEGPRETIPIRDENGVFVGMSSRLTFESEDVPKYRILKDFDKNSHLYGLHVAKNYREEFHSTVILTEGFTDVWAFSEIGIPIAVCSMGTSVSNIQRYLIGKYFDKCIVFYDGDSPGKKGTEKVVSFIKNFVKVIPFYPEDGLEPSKYGKDKLKEIAMNVLNGVRTQ